MLHEEGDGKLLDGVNLRFELDELVAFTGAPGGGREHLALVLSRLAAPTSGHITVGGVDLAVLPEAVTGRRMAYVGQDSYLFPVSLRDNLLYGLKHLPLHEEIGRASCRERVCQYV